jgi:hypothetical protein
LMDMDSGYCIDTHMLHAGREITKSRLKAQFNPVKYG